MRSKNSARLSGSKWLNGIFGGGNSTLTRGGTRRRSSRAAKPTSTYRCSDYECEGSTFTSASALVRHKNENHLTTELFFCPVRECPRSRRGFHRQHNLMVHTNGKKHR